MAEKEVKPRAAWRGTVAFGLAGIPVGLFPARKPHTVKLGSVHRGCGAPVRMRRVCEVHGEELATAEIQRAAHVGDVDVPVPDRVMDSLPAGPGRVAKVVGFAPANSVSPDMITGAYRVEPEKSGVAAYALMRAAMAKTRTVAVATVAFNGSESLAVFAPNGHSITMLTVAWPDEMQGPRETAPMNVKAAELKVAAELVASMPASLTDVRDARNDALRSAVAKLPVPDQATAPQPAVDDVDLIGALRASVKAASETPKARSKK